MWSSGSWMCTMSTRSTPADRGCRRATAHGVVAEVEPGIDRAVGTVVQQATDLRRDHDDRGVATALPRRLSHSPSP